MNGSNDLNPKPIHPFFSQFDRSTGGEMHGFTKVSRVALSTARKQLVPVCGPTHIETLSIASSDSDVEIVSERPSTSTGIMTGMNPPLHNSPPRLWKPQVRRGKPAASNKPPQEVPPQASTSTSEVSDLQHQFYFFDLEATGLVTKEARIIDLAVVERDTGQTFSSLVDPQRSIPGEVQKLTGLRNKDVKGQPGISEVLGSMIKFIELTRLPGTTPVLVAHNGKLFDFQLIIEEAARSSINLPDDWLCLDTLMLAKKMKLKERTDGKLNQDALRELYHIPQPVKAHLALPDAQVLAKIFEGIMAEIISWSNGQSLYDIFESVGAMDALFPLSNIQIHADKMEQKLTESLEKELSSLPDYSFVSLEDIKDSSALSMQAFGPLRDAENKKICFLVRGASIIYSLCSGKMEYAYNGVNPAWKIQLCRKSPGVDLALSVLSSKDKSLVSKEVLPVHINCVKEIEEGIASWSLKTQLIDLKAKNSPIKIELESCRIDSANLEEIKRRNLELVDSKLMKSTWKSRSCDVLMEASSYTFSGSEGIKLTAVRIFIS